MRTSSGDRVCRKHARLDAADEEFMAKKTTSRSKPEAAAAAAAPAKPRTRAKATRKAGDKIVGDPPAGTKSVSMGSEPSEDDIRIRAYHRYLERGGGHGLHFDDWVEAKRDLEKK
jgi:hypothetical protein